MFAWVADNSIIASNMLMKFSRNCQVVTMLSWPAAAWRQSVVGRTSAYICHLTSRCDIFNCHDSSPVDIRYSQLTYIYCRRLQLRRFISSPSSDTRWRAPSQTSEAKRANWRVSEWATASRCDHVASHKAARLSGVWFSMPHHVRWTLTVEIVLIAKSCSNNCPQATTCVPDDVNTHHRAFSSSSSSSSKLRSVR